MRPLAASSRLVEFVSLEGVRQRHRIQWGNIDWGWDSVRTLVTGNALRDERGGQRRPHGTLRVPRVELCSGVGCSFQRYVIISFLVNQRLAVRGPKPSFARPVQRVDGKFHSNGFIPCRASIRSRNLRRGNPLAPRARESQRAISRHKVEGNIITSAGKLLVYC